MKKFIKKELLILIFSAVLTFIIFLTCNSFAFEKPQIKEINLEKQKEDGTLFGLFVIFVLGCVFLGGVLLVQIMKK